MYFIGDLCIKLILSCVIHNNNELGKHLKWNYGGS